MSATGDDVRWTPLDEDAVVAEASALAAELTALGCAAGDLVCALAGNHPGFVAARLAATALELVFAPLNPRLAPAEVAALCAYVRPRALLVDDAHAAVVDGVTVPALRLGRSGPAPGDRTGFDAARIGATVLFTSGTTGRPKACLRPEAAEAARVAELTATYAITADDVHLITCPLAHSAPGILLRAARAAGARTVLVDRFRPRGFLVAAAATGATLTFLVPTQCYRLLELPPAERPVPPSLRAVIVAGAPLAPAVKDRLLDWLGPDRLWEFYGSSETGTITVIGPGEHRAHVGSVGRPPPGVSVRVLDEHGAAVAAGVDGEVFVRSAALMAGYLTDDGDLVRPDERDGHLSVGDLGRVDADGWLTLVDRKHDTIISGGSNVYPAEVEAALAAHPAVAGAVVFGVDDPEWGQVVTAVVAPRARAAPPTIAELTACCRARLAGYKLPRRWATCAIDDLPIGGSGKALRRAARAAYDEGRYQPLV